MDVTKKHSAQRDAAGRKGPNSTSNRSANLPRPLMAGPFPSMSPSWDQMKPRTVYEKAVQDFTETAQQLARLNQHFRQASFSEFEMLMGLDDEVLKRYGLPKPTVKRALLEVYQTVVLDQQR
jgi:hypothetical protein